MNTKNNFKISDHSLKTLRKNDNSAQYEIFLSYLVDLEKGRFVSYYFSNKKTAERFLKRFERFINETVIIDLFGGSQRVYNFSEMLNASSVSNFS